MYAEEVEKMLHGRRCERVTTVPRLSNPFPNTKIIPATFFASQIGLKGAYFYDSVILCNGEQQLGKAPVEPNYCF